MQNLATNAPATEPAISTRPEPSKLVRVEEAARLLGVGGSTVWQKISAGRIKATKIGGRTLIARDEIERVAANGC